MPKQSLPNLVPPYNVNLQFGVYSFTTDQELIYKCSFNNVTPRLSPVLGIYDIEIYDFDFFPFDINPTIKKVKDDRISATIIKLLKDFFISPLRVLIYLCDSADGRARERQYLFGKWHHNNEDINRDDLTIEIEDEITIYGCIMTPKDFPHYDILQNELLDNASGIMIEKYGS